MGEEAHPIGTLLGGGDIHSDLSGDAAVRSLDNGGEQVGPMKDRTVAQLGGDRRAALHKCCGDNAHGHLGLQWVVWQVERGDDVVTNMMGNGFWLRRSRANRHVGGIWMRYR